MIDTHCHLNFKSFKNKLSSVINNAKNAGVNVIIVPGTDIDTSRTAVKLSYQFEGVFSAVGIHPHHVFKIKNSPIEVKKSLTAVEELLNNDSVVAVGEVGIDKYKYEKTVYADYKTDEFFINNQIQLLAGQIKLAKKYNKSLILHNRKATREVLGVLQDNWSEQFSGKVVFHCCEPDEQLLKFSADNNIYIGVNGDITYRKDKQEFIKKVPLNRLVLETDSPFLIPEPYKSEGIFPNEPRNLGIILRFTANLLNIKPELLEKHTNNNSRMLFQLPQPIINPGG